MNKLSTKRIGIVAMTTTAVFSLGLVIATAQQKKSSCGALAIQQSKPFATPVCCPAKSSGQICDDGTAGLLKLDSANREGWAGAVRRYNSHVESAQKQLIEEARGFLTPEQTEQLESYFGPAKSRAALPQTTSANKPGLATIKVTGMTCDGCAKSVERALSKVDGVRGAKVIYERGIAEVTYNDSRVTLDQLHAVIRETGFGIEEGYVPQAAEGPSGAASQVDSARASFYDVPLVCGAAPEIGCGSRAKPILQELQRHQAVAEALLNRPGTMIAVLWAEDSTPAQRAEAVAATAKKSDLSIKELAGDRREAALREFAAKASWYRSSEVDRLSEEEGDIVGARLVRRVRAKTTLSDRQADELGTALSVAFKRCILDSGKRTEGLREEEFLSAGREHLSKEGLVALKQALSLGYRPLPGEK